MATKIWSINLMLFVTLLTSIAQILYKLSIKNLQFDFVSIATNYYLIGGVALYGIGALLTVIAFRGGEVSVLYPIVATSYIWVSFLSAIFLKELMNIIKLVGIFTIISGIVLISVGSRKNKHNIS